MEDTSRTQKRNNLGRPQEVNLHAQSTRRRSYKSPDETDLYQDMLILEIVNKAEQR